jgi:hypothetical protein
MELIALGAPKTEDEDRDDGDKKEEDNKEDTWKCEQGEPCTWPVEQVRKATTG